VGLVATGGLEPDLTFVLELPSDVSMSRRKPSADRMESRSAEFFEKVRAGFLAEAARRPDRFRVIDAAPAVDVVQQRLRDEVASLTA
jgi:dTMP kinase